MKKIFTLIACLFTIHTFLFAQTDNTKITDESIGDMQVRKSINKFKSYKGWTIKQEAKTINGDKQTRYKIWENSKLIFEIIPVFNHKTMKYTDKIDQVITYSSKYATAKGLMVGSTLETVLSKHPEGSIVKNPEGNLLVQSNTEYILYIIDPKSYIGPKEKLKHHESTYSIDDFSKDAKIIAIQIFDVREEVNM